jgi:hypothetical protein
MSQAQWISPTELCQKVRHWPAVTVGLVGNKSRKERSEIPQAANVSRAVVVRPESSTLPFDQETHIPPKGLEGTIVKP